MGVLIQDISELSEIVRFEQFHVYRRNSPECEPAYFAPYFTREAPRPTGISSLCHVRGVLHFPRLQLNQYEEIIRQYTDNDALADQWIAGVLHHDENGVFTYYFLEPTQVLFHNRLLKDPPGAVDEGLGWISRMIPQNRIVEINVFSHRYAAHGNGQLVL